MLNEGLFFKGGIFKNGDKWLNTIGNDLQKDLFVMEWNSEGKFLIREILDINDLTPLKKEEARKEIKNSLTIKKNIENNIKFIKELMKVNDLVNIEINIIESSIGNDYEYYVYKIEGISVEFYHRRNGNSEYNFAYLPGYKKSIFLENIENELNENIYNQIIFNLLNDKKVKIKRIFK